MKTFSNIASALLLMLATTAAQAELFLFSYTFDANIRGTPGHELSGVIDGTLLDDGDTIIIHNVKSASLAGIPYDISNFIGIRAANFGDQPVMSLSGATLDFWVCPQGFTTDNNGGDCPFGAEGGFLVSQNWPAPGSSGAWAGIPELGDSYRDGDIPFVVANWSAEPVTEVRVTFNYTFEANVRGTPGNILSGEVDGILLADGDTVEITDLRKASLGGQKYKLNKKFVGIRAADPTATARMSLSGNVLDFWICPLGFSTVNQGGGDCPFGAEGGFLISQDWPSTGAYGAWAGVPALGLSYRDGDIPINAANWQATISKVVKAKKPKKQK